MQSAGSTSDKVAGRTWRAYCRARDAGHLDYVESAKKCDRFYSGGGEQWDEQDKAALEAEGRPALEINMIMSTVNAMLGEHINQRADIVLKPRNETTELNAEIKSKLLETLLDENQFHWRENMVVSDGLIQDRGFFDVRLDFSEDPRGKLKLTAEDPLTIIPDPDAKDYDPSQWNEVFKTRWMTLDEVEVMYGKEHRKKVEAHVDTYGGYGSDSIKFEDNRFGDTNADTGLDVEAETGRAVRRVRVIERQYRKVVPVTYLVDPSTGSRKELPPNQYDEEQINRIAMKYGLEKMTFPKSKIRWSVCADGHTLHDDWSPYSHFTIVPYFPYFRRGKPFGVVRNLISPQEQLNKLESQELHIVNTTANSGWIVESGSLVNMTPDDLEERGAETGLVMVYRAGKEKPEKIPPNSIPSGIDRASEKAANSIRVISGVYDAMLGAEKPSVSGVALNNRVSRGLVQLQVPFDNLARTRHILTEVILSIIGDYFTEQRVFSIVNYQDPRKSTEQIEVNNPDQPDTILSNGEYDIVISTAPARDNFQETQFAEAIQLREAGVVVPDDVVIENSHLANKKEIAERVRQMQGMTEPTPEQQAQAEKMQQMQEQMMMLQMQELEAKVAKLQSDAQLSGAKAQTTVEQVVIDKETEIARLEMDMQKMRNQMEQFYANLENKIDLADIHSKNKTDLTVYQTASKRIGDQAQRAMQERIATMQNETQKEAARRSGLSQKERNN